MSPTADVAPAIDLEALPGFQVRRLHQIAVALFLQEAADTGITPVQFGALQGIANQPGIDQRTLARSIGLDTSTLAGVIDRLESRALVQRSASPHDRRVRLLTLTPAGHELLAELVPAMQRAQLRILAPLPAAQRREFMRMLNTLVGANNEWSRAPSEPA